MKQQNCHKQLAILLATYNSEKYLCEQLDSLFAQTYKDWTLYVHDDGSSDSTLSIIKEYTQKYTNIVVLDFASTGGAKSNFMHMLSCVEADYYMFCDHDDVWLDHKVEITLNHMIETEKSCHRKPIIVHTDLYVVSEDLKLMYPSFWDYEGIYPNEIQSFEMLAAFNLATGCTMMINAKAKEITPKDCPEAMMHDSWITAAVLWAHGEIVGINQPTVYYRQHGDNCLGVREPHLSLKDIMRNISSILKQNKRKYQMLNKIGHISVISFIKAKMEGRRILLLHKKENK